MPKPIYPHTRTDATVETLHGERIPDPYRWLEDGESPETQAWTAAQNAITKSYLDAVPSRGAIRARLEQLLTIGAISAPTPARGRYFYQRRDGTAESAGALRPRRGRRRGPGAARHQRARPPPGPPRSTGISPATTAPSWPTGFRRTGARRVVLRVMRWGPARTCRIRSPIPAPADLAWLPDGSSFYYTRYPAPGEVPAGEDAVPPGRLFTTGWGTIRPGTR